MCSNKDRLRNNAVYLELSIYFNKTFQIYVNKARDLNVHLQTKKENYVTSVLSR